MMKERLESSEHISSPSIDYLSQYLHRGSPLLVDLGKESHKTFDKQHTKS